MVNTYNKQLLKLDYCLINRKKYTWKEEKIEITNKNCLYTDQTKTSLSERTVVGVAANDTHYIQNKH